MRPHGPMVAITICDALNACSRELYGEMIFVEAGVTNWQYLRFVLRGLGLNRALVDVLTLKDVILSALIQQLND